MRRRFQVSLASLFLILPLLTMVACSSGKHAQSKATVLQANAPETLCGRTVRYSIERSVVTSDSGEEKDDNTPVEITLDPGGSQLVMKGPQSGQSEKTSLKLESCDLSAGMQQGEAVYTTIDEKRTENGNTVLTTVSIKVEAMNGVVTLTVYASGKKGGIKATVAKWEVVE